MSASAFPGGAAPEAPGRHSSTGTVPPHVRLANEIAVQFHTRAPEEAAATIAAHIRQFWDPRMRAQLIEHVDAGGADLDPLAVEAARRLRPGAVR